MVVHVTFKHEEDQINMEGARVATIVYVIFSDAQGKIIP